MCNLRIFYLVSGITHSLNDENIVPKKSLKTVNFYVLYWTINIVWAEYILITYHLTIGATHVILFKHEILIN